jgi:putative flippase GtrA
LEIVKNKKPALEFLRYSIFGGIAFIADFAVLFIFKKFILRDFYYSLHICTAFGLISGLIIIYLFFYVFSSARGSKIGRSMNEILIFIVVGIIGLIVSELGMLIVSNKLGLNYLLVKTLVTIVVL